MNSKCGVQSKRRCESHESCVCIVGFSACGCQKKSVVYETECIRHVAVHRDKHCQTYWTERDRDRETQRDRDRETQRDKDRERERERESDRDRERQTDRQRQPHVSTTSSFPVQHPCFETAPLTLTYNKQLTNLFCIYRPPPSKKNKFSDSMFFDQFSDFLEHSDSLPGKTLLMGDFNFHFENVENNNSRKLHV